MYRLDGYEMDGRRLAVVEAKDKRKTPDELRAREQDRGGDRRRSRSRSRDRDVRGRGRGGSRDRYVSVLSIYFDPCRY